MVLEVRRVDPQDEELFSVVCRIRQRVFLEEYGLKPEEDTEPVDFAATTFHFLGFDTESQAYVAVARSVLIDNSEKVQLGRIAVLPEARGRRHGHVIVAFAEQELKQWQVPVKSMFLFSIPEKRKFYERCGFSASGHSEVVRDLLLFEMVKEL